MTAPQMLTASDVREMLRRECEKAGGQKAWALAHNMSANLPGMFMREGHRLSPTATRALGLKMIPFWTVDEAHRRVLDKK